MLATQIFLLPTALAQTPAKPKATVDLSGIAELSGFSARSEDKSLTLTWRISPTESGLLQINLEPEAPLITLLGLTSAGKTRTLLRNMDPLVFVTVGSRNLLQRAIEGSFQPGDPTAWMAFFDNPAQRPYHVSPMKLDKRHVRVSSVGERLNVVVSEASAPPFRGRFEFTLFTGSPLIFAEAVLQTAQDGCAFLYDAGLTTSTSRVEGLYETRPNWKLAWLEPTEARLQRVQLNLNHIVAPVSVSRRTIVAESPEGSVAVFPPPHQYFAPLDFGSNLGSVWHGRSGNAQFSGYGFGVRQPPDGDRRWVPWINAPPQTEQRMGIFYLLSSGDAAAVLDEAGRYTNHDRFKRIPGHVTFSSHYHIEHTLRLATARKESGDPKSIPEELRDPGFVRSFKALGIDIVHLGEFHVGQVPRLSPEQRLPLLKTMFAECERLSDGQLLLLPGEEPNVHLGGHWMALFPKPVYWVLNRPKDAPFESAVPGYGRVYRVGDASDVLNLMEREQGLMWTAHPRIKSSRGYPDKYFDETFFKADRFLGGAWKSMPVDLSLPRLGSRVLDLQDAMSNRGERKYIIGEADLFDIEPGMELYGHLNINYLKIDRVPKFSESWLPVLGALRDGKFFVSTGEVLLPVFTVGGKSSGESLSIATGDQPRLKAKIEWTFPLSFAEIVSGDGQKIYRQRVDLADTTCFGSRDLDVSVDLKGRSWVRLEVWDIARNGAFTPPIWLEHSL